MKTFPILFAILTLPLLAEEKALQKQDKKVPTVEVAGEVRKPGVVAYHENVTILAVIFTAGGATPLGAMNRVIVNRGGKTLQFDLSEDKGKTEPAKPNDRIEVPKKNVLGR